MYPIAMSDIALRRQNHTAGLRQAVAPKDWCGDVNGAAAKLLRAALSNTDALACLGASDCVQLSELRELRCSPREGKGRELKGSGVSPLFSPGISTMGGPSGSTRCYLIIINNARGQPVPSPLRHAS